MKFLCFIFGHQPPVYGHKGWWSPGEEYADVVGDYEDGVGRHHAEVKANCARCGEKFRVCRIHIPKTGEEK